MRIVIALGGNALLRRGEPAEASVQRRNVEIAARAVAEVAAEHQVVVTHGNGPQVGLLALQSETYRGVGAYPLDVIGAESEGMIGYLLEQALSNRLLGREVATLLTQVVVDPDDPAFASPTKPVGPVYTEAEARRLAAERGWTVAPDGKHFRRVVPSPEPQDVVEIRTIQLLVDAGVVVICVGGGGIPVVVDEAGGLRGVEAVIDKDLSAALLARLVHADFLLMLTDVVAVERGDAGGRADPPRDSRGAARAPARFRVDGAEGRGRLPLRRGSAGYRGHRRARGRGGDRQRRGRHDRRRRLSRGPDDRAIESAGLTRGYGRDGTARRLRVGATLRRGIRGVTMDDAVGGEGMAEGEPWPVLARELEPVVMWTTDAELRFTASSGGGLTVLGLEAGQTVGVTLYEYFGTTDSSFLPVAAHLRALAGESQGYELEWTGRTFRTRVEPLRSVQGEIVGVAGIAVDVTGERQAAAALRETEDRFRSAFDDAAIGMAIVAPNGRFVRVNRALCELSGFSEDELLGLTVRDLTHPSDWEENRRHIRDVLAGKARTFQMEKRYVAKDGSEISVLLSASLVRDAAGEPRYFVSEMQDVTERKRTEEQLREAQKMDAIGQLAGGVAHDFNNLLAAIRGYAELVLTRLGDEDPLRKDVGEIASAADRASSLTRQLLAFSRRQVLQPAVLDPNAVVVDMERMLHRLIGEHIELVTALEPGLSRVRADRGQIEQVILNLAVNARDAMHEGGRLTIATSNLELDAAGARRHPDLAPGRYVVLSASDTGAGIDARTKERVFEPFFTTKEPGKGTGLGLATVYGIVRQSGGQVKVESEPGCGATFTVYLPPAGDAVPLPESGAEPAPASTAGRGIVLLVEDDGQVRRLTHRLLEQEGYSVVTAPNAASALALSSRGEPIDLVLTDVVMPGMNGPELVELLRRERPDVGVLYMSGYADDQVIGRQELEADALLLEKPFTRELLGRKVREALAAGPGRRSAG